MLFLQESEESWIEFNCTTQVKGDMAIYEPCNYASNVAYYHTVLEMCQREDWSLDNSYGKSP